MITSLDAFVCCVQFQPDGASSRKQNLSSFFQHKTFYLVRSKNLDMETNKIHNMDCLEGLRALPDNFADIAITSPLYWGQRGDEGIGLEEDPREYVQNLTTIFLELMRVLKEDGVFWFNIGDSYNTPINWKEEDHLYSTLGPNGNGLKPDNSAYTKKRGSRRAFINKGSGWLQYGNMLALPWRIILNLCDAGYFFRGEVVWAKRKAMPEGKCRRPHRKHEPIYVLAKSGHHKFTTTPPVSSVWDLKPDPNVAKGDHIITFPLSLPLTYIESSGFETGLVLDPFMGSGTTAIAAITREFDYVGFELNPNNIITANKRIGSVQARLFV